MNLFETVQIIQNNLLLSGSDQLLLMHYFYSTNKFSNHFILEDEEALHANVLRLKENDLIYIANGIGDLYTCKIGTLEKRKIEGVVLEHKVLAPITPHLTMALSPTKSIDRYEWFLEKATELGVQSFIPIITAKSERKLVNIDRMKKIILSAMKQSGRAWLPNISEPISFKSFINQSLDGIKMIAHVSGRKVSDVYSKTFVKNNFTLLIGPEGDFTSDELNEAMKNGYLAVSLGEYRLRTETAGVKLAALICD